MREGKRRKAKKWTSGEVRLTPMSSTTSSSSHQQRILQRERERYQRERQQVNNNQNSNSIGGQLIPTSGQSISNTLFAEPIKKAQEDETTRRIKSTLGDFNQVQLCLNYDSKPLLGLTTRDLSRINGNKAKIEQIFSEMKQTFQPLIPIDSDSSSSSESSNSASSSSASSSSSSSSSEDDDDDEEAMDSTDKPEGRSKAIENSFGTDVPTGKGSASSVKSQCRSPHQPEISTWNLSNFMDKKTIPPSRESTKNNNNSYVNKESVKEKNDSINDVIDRVARGELGEHYTSSSDHPLRSHSTRQISPVSSSSSRKKRKSSQSVAEQRRTEEQQQILQQNHMKHEQLQRQKHQSQPSSSSPPSLSSQMPDYQEPRLTAVSEPVVHRSKAASKLLPNNNNSRELTESNNTNNIISNCNINEKDSSPKVPDKLLVSISLLLLKRIPGQNNRVKHEFDNENTTQLIKNEPLSPHHWSSSSLSLPHTALTYRNKRYPASPQPPG